MWFDEYAVNAQGVAEKSLAAKGYLGQPVGKVQELLAGDLSIVASIDFESGLTPPPGLTLGPAMELTNDSGEVLGGLTSARVTYDTADPLSSLIFWLDTQVAPLEVGTLYQAFMTSRVVSQTAPFEHNFLMTVAFDDGAFVEGSNLGGILWDADDGQTGIVRTGLLVEQSGTTLYGFVGAPAAIIVDDIYIISGASAFRRDFENGIALVNPSPQPVTLSQSEVAGPLGRMGIRRILGTQDPNWNDGSAVTTGIALPPADGIVLLADTISAPAVTTPTNLTTVSVAGDSVALQWQPTSPAAGYVVHYGIAGGDATQFALAGKTSETEVRNLRDNTAYVFTVQAFDWLGRLGPQSGNSTTSPSSGGCTGRGSGLSMSRDRCTRQLWWC